VHPQGTISLGHQWPSPGGISVAGHEGVDVDQRVDVLGNAVGDDVIRDLVDEWLQYYCVPVYRRTSPKA
jgi:hypothetical protein